MDSIPGRSRSKKIRKINFGNFFSKNVDLTEKIVDFSLKIVIVVFHSGEKWKIYSHQKKKFRQINSFVKTLLSRNYCQKCVRLNCSNFHTVCVFSSLWLCLPNYCTKILWNQIKSFFFREFEIFRKFLKSFWHICFLCKA